MGIKNFWPFGKSPHSRFEELIGPHLNKLYRLAYRLTGQRDDAEDLVQDLLLKLYPRLEELQDIEKLAPWLARILYHLFIDKVRRQQKSPITYMSDDETIYDTHASQIAEPSELANAEITLHLINSALKNLSEDHRILIMLHDVEGYSLQEINNMTGTPVGTIKSRLSRARHKLRQIILNREPEFLDDVNTGKRL